MSPSTLDALAAQLDAQAAHFNALFAAMDAGITYDGNSSAQEPDDALDELPLEVTVKRRICVLLTYGGPTVTAEADLDDTDSISNARLTGHWGNEHIERQLSPDGGLFRGLQHYATLTAEQDRCSDPA
jgi:hypothetical protein